MPHLGILKRISWADATYKYETRSNAVGECMATTSAATGKIQAPTIRTGEANTTRPSNTKELLRGFVEVLPKAIEEEMDKGLRYNGCDPGIILELHTQAFSRLLSEGWANINYIGIFERALDMLSERGMKIDVHLLNFRRRYTNKTTNELLEKIGITDWHGFYIDKARFITDIYGSIMSLEGYKEHIKHRVAARIFRENGIKWAEIRNTAFHDYSER